MNAPQPRFRISRHRRVAWLGSGLAALLSVIGLLVSWLNPAIHAPLKPGLDFTGGTQIQLERRCEPAGCSVISAPEIQQVLAQLKLPAEQGEEAPRLNNVAVQILDQGQSLVLRLQDLNPVQASSLVQEIQSIVGPLNPDSTSVDTIGPTLGQQLLKGSVVSLVVSFVAIAAYITFRYDGVFAFLAIFTLGHDVLLTCGAFAWLGLIAGVEVDSLFAVSLITVAGYSVTDTVVVFDRIREQRTTLADLPLTDQVDVAVDATLTRSLYTSFTTLLPLLGLIFFGGASLFWFAVALTIGIAVGSWSSIGVAPTLLLVLSRSRR
jgi:preprotein translocase subunit SecF